MNRYFNDESIEVIKMERMHTDKKIRVRLCEFSVVRNIDVKLMCLQGALQESHCRVGIKNCYLQPLGLKWFVVQ